MHGYVRTHTPDLRMRDQHVYRAIYCGLCHRMGRCTGQCSRLSLSYDFVLLAALRMSLCGEQHKEKKKRCILHWIRPHAVVIDSPTLDYCAYASAILTREKCRDDIMDERGWRRLRARLGLLLFGGAGRRAAKKYPQLQETIRTHLQRLHEHERDPQAMRSADLPASIFGTLMGEVFAHALVGSDERIARSFGDAIGRWIYLADAAEDLSEDLKKNRFNPYLRLYEDRVPKEEEWEDIRLSLRGHLSHAERAYLLVDHFPRGEYQEILCNILYLGLPAITDRVTQSNRQGEHQ